MEGGPGDPRPTVRPPALSAAAGILFVVGVLNVLGGFLLFRFGALFGLLGLAVGAAAIFAGSKVLVLDDRGRAVGMGVAGISLAIGIYNLTQGFTAALVGVALNGFVLWALSSNAGAFRKA